MRFAIMLWLIILALLASNAESQVSFHVGCYNSYDEMSISLAGNNFDWVGKTTLDSDSIHYKNGGSSTESECSYSFEMALNGDVLKSGATTNSGAFAWNAEIVSDHGESNSGEVFRLSAKHMVENGVLDTFYGSSDFKSNAHLLTTNAAYVEKLEAKSKDIEVNGKGFTISDPSTKTSSEPSDNADQETVSELTSIDDTKLSDEKESSGETEPSDETEPAAESDPVIKGFTQTVTTSQNGKSGDIITNILGDTEVAWNNGINAEQAGYSFGIILEGKSESSMEQLSVKGEATGIPKQSLPPGEVTITVEEPNPLQELEDFSDYIEEESDRFLEDYPEDPIQESWYILNQKVYVNPVKEKDYTIPRQGPAQYYRMNMGFSVGLL